jgi:hypothetical protein
MGGCGYALWPWEAVENGAWVLVGRGTFTGGMQLRFLPGGD